MKNLIFSTMILIIVSFQANARVGFSKRVAQYCQANSQDSDRCFSYCQQNPQIASCTRTLASKVSAANQSVSVAESQVESVKTQTLTAAQLLEQQQEEEKEQKKRQKLMLFAALLPSLSRALLPLPEGQAGPPLMHDDRNLPAILPEPQNPNNYQPGVAPSAQQAPNVRVRNTSDATGPKLLLITDQAGSAAAIAIRETFRTKAPFSCLNLTIEIHEITPDELNCRPYAERRLIKCRGPGREKALQIQRERNALSAILIVNFNQWAGSGYPDIPVVSTALHPLGAVHELMHAIGFHDEYTEGRPTVAGGTIMNSLEGNIPKEWWPNIAGYFGEPAVPNCTP